MECIICSWCKLPHKKEKLNFREVERSDKKHCLLSCSSGTDNRFRLALKASVTVEATYAFSIFFFAILLLCTMFFAVRTGYREQRKLITDAYEISSYGALIKKAEGLLFETENDDLIMESRFQIETPVTFFGVTPPNGTAKVRFRLFTGTEYTSLLKEKGGDGDASDDCKVYVTDSGKVYHTSMSCPAIKIDMRAVSSLVLDAERNDSGGKYYPCEKCATKTLPMVVYVTGDGSRYHCSASCSALKRTAKEVKLSEVGDRRECKRCCQEK